jgi:hypothetical protein
LTALLAYSPYHGEQAARRDSGLSVLVGSVLMAAKAKSQAGKNLPNQEAIEKPEGEKAPPF